MMLTIIAILLLIYIHQQSKRARYDRVMREREERMTQSIYMRMIEERKKENEIRLYIEEQEMR